MNFMTKIRYAFKNSENLGEDDEKTLTAANHSTRSTASTKAEENSNNSSTVEKGNKKQTCKQPLDHQKKICSKSF